MRKPRAAGERDEDEIVHRLKNQLAIVIGLSELLLEDLPEADPTRRDIQEINRAAVNAMATVPELSRRLPRRADG